MIQTWRHQCDPRIDRSGRFYRERARFSSNCRLGTGMLSLAEEDKVQRHSRIHSVQCQKHVVKTKTGKCDKNSPLVGEIGEL